MALLHGNTQHTYDLCRPPSGNANNSVNSPSTATILIPSFSALATALLGCSTTTNNQHLQQQKTISIQFSQHLQQQKTISIQFSPRWYLRAQESPQVFEALGIHTSLFWATFSLLIRLKSAEMEWNVSTVTQWPNTRLHYNQNLFAAVSFLSYENSRPSGG